MKRKAIIISGIAAITLAALAATSWYRRGDSKFAASGTLEARNISIGSKIGGRVAKVLVNEGDRVEAGQVLLVFDSPEVEARLVRARGDLEQARANYEKMLHGSRPEEIAQARAAAGDGKEPGYRVHEIEQARADLERARSDAANAGRKWQRYRELFEEGVVSREQRDDAETQYRMATASAETAAHAVAAAEGRLREAAAIEQKTVTGNRAEDIAMARAQVESAEGALREAEANWAEREVRSPARAVVEVMDIRPGDLLPANAPIARLLEADQLYVMVYVPQSQIGRIRVGQQADLTVDAFPNQPFRARVEQIRQQAEFLPRNVETKAEREHQVVGVKLRVENSENKLRAGIHADVRFTEAK
ncbi:MAG TPA: efflux RND transporter periplasmic adaptor subunit [Terriglobales bacterium]|nr:efflux RND transporter periplasmic adaptor subunit [Terriglobales bacterium]